MEGLPPAFRTKIARALRDYDIDTLEPGPELEDAVYRLFLALQRMENQIPVITALLGRWRTADDVASASTSAVGEVLERLVRAQRRCATRLSATSRVTCGSACSMSRRSVRRASKSTTEYAKRSNISPTILTRRTTRHASTPLSQLRSY